MYDYGIIIHDTGIIVNIFFCIFLDYGCFFCYSLVGQAGKRGDRMKERLIVLRKSLSLSQEAFGKRLGVTGTAISRIEIGNRGITEQMILAICREFNVNHAWFTEGIGEMFANIPETILDELALQFDLSDKEKELISDFCNMPKAQRDVIMKFLRKD